MLKKDNIISIYCLYNNLKEILFKVKNDEYLAFDSRHIWFVQDFQTNIQNLEVSNVNEVYLDFRKRIDKKRSAMDN